MEEVRQRIEVPLASGNSAVSTLCVGRLDGLMEARGEIAETGVAFYAVLPEGVKYGDDTSLKAIASHCDSLEQAQADADALAQDAKAQTLADLLADPTLSVMDAIGAPVVGLSVQVVSTGKIIGGKGVIPVGDQVLGARG